MDERGPWKFWLMSRAPNGLLIVPVLIPHTSVALTNTSGRPSESAARASYSRRLTPAVLACRRSETECRVVRASSYDSVAASVDWILAMNELSNAPIRNERKRALDALRD